MEKHEFPDVVRVHEGAPFCVDVGKAEEIGILQSLVSEDIKQYLSEETRVAGTEHRDRIKTAATPYIVPI